MTSLGIVSQPYQLEDIGSQRSLQGNSLSSTRKNVQPGTNRSPTESPEDHMTPHLGTPYEDLGIALSQNVECVHRTPSIARIDKPVLWDEGDQGSYLVPEARMPTFRPSIISESDLHLPTPLSPPTLDNGIDWAMKAPESPKEVDIHDHVSLLLFLSKVNLSKYGFDKDLKDSLLEQRFVSKVKPESPRSFYRSSQDEDDFYTLPKPKKRRSPVDYAIEDSEVPTSSPRKKDSPRSSTSSPRAPYKGRYGLHPKCGSCGTSKTPYWRESWTEAFILCNACGLRFSKFRRRCVKCNYVPRKEDKGARECTQCSGPWSQ